MNVPPQPAQFLNLRWLVAEVLPHVCSRAGYKQASSRRAAQRLTIDVVCLLVCWFVSLLVSCWALRTAPALGTAIHAHATLRRRF